jgi:hypothetical protein
MSVFHVIAHLPDGETKGIYNCTEDKALERVTEFMRDQTFTTQWGDKTLTRQAHQLKVYETKTRFDRRKTSFAAFIKGKQNAYGRLEKEIERRTPKRKTRVFVVTPIQGDKYGSQDDQRTHKEYNDRFDVVDGVLQEFDCVAIRIDKVESLEGLVDRIKAEIGRASFVVADLTDERPSCYFEAGYAAGLGRPVITMASKESVLHPGTDTKIHFDIHQNVRFFSNHSELAEKLRTAIEQNRETLIPSDDPIELVSTKDFPGFRERVAAALRAT